MGAKVCAGEGSAGLGTFQDVIVPVEKSSADGGIVLDVVDAIGVPFQTSAYAVKDVERVSRKAVLGWENDCYGSCPAKRANCFQHVFQGVVGRISAVFNAKQRVDAVKTAAPLQKTKRKMQQLRAVVTGDEQESVHSTGIHLAAISRLTQIKFKSRTVSR